MNQKRLLWLPSYYFASASAAALRLLPRLWALPASPAWPLGCGCSAARLRLLGFQGTAAKAAACGFASTCYGFGGCLPVTAAAVAAVALAVALLLGKNNKATTCILAHTVKPCGFFACFACCLAVVAFCLYLIGKDFSQRPKAAAAALAKKRPSRKFFFFVFQGLYAHFA